MPSPSSSRPCFCCCVDELSATFHHTSVKKLRWKNIFPEFRILSSVFIFSEIFFFARGGGGFLPSCAIRRAGGTAVNFYCLFPSFFFEGNRRSARSLIAVSLKISFLKNLFFCGTRRHVPHPFSFFRAAVEGNPLLCPPPVSHTTTTDKGRKRREEGVIWPPFHFPSVEERRDAASWVTKNPLISQTWNGKRKETDGSPLVLTPSCT